MQVRISEAYRGEGYMVFRDVEPRELPEDIRLYEASMEGFGKSNLFIVKEAIFGSKVHVPVAHGHSFEEASLKAYTLARKYAESLATKHNCNIFDRTSREGTVNLK